MWVEGLGIIWEQPRKEQAPRQSFRRWRACSPDPQLPLIRLMSEGVLRKRRFYKTGSVDTYKHLYISYIIYYIFYIIYYINIYMILYIYTKCIHESLHTHVYTYTCICPSSIAYTCVSAHMYLYIHRVHRF